MSWFARSIADTLNFDDDTDQDLVNKNSEEDVSTNQKHDQKVDENDSPLSPGRGVKEDLSEITKTLTRQFWGVASLLAPPPPPEQSNEQSEPADPESTAPEAIDGIRRDFAEIGGRFRSGISKLSNNIDVSEITKMASNFLQLGPEDEDYDSSKSDGAIGVTDEVVAFVRDIAMHPGTWLDFPLPEDENEDEDFDLSDAQQEHALAVERLAPRLAALRFELCPEYMSERSFWKIYFVLLHPKLDRHDAAILSTPEIMEARASLTHELKHRSNVHSKENKNIPESAQNEHHSAPSSSQYESIPIEISASADKETEKRPISSKEIQIIEIQEEPHNESKPEDQNLQSNTTSNAHSKEKKNIPASAQNEHHFVPSSKYESIPIEISASPDKETEKRPISSKEIQIIEIQEEPCNRTKPEDQNIQSKTTSNVPEAKDEDDTDDWLKEESSQTVTSRTTIPIENDEDVSFSDLEEDEDDGGDGDVLTTYKKATYGSDSSTKDSRDWVQLGRSSADSLTIERTGSGQVSAHNSEAKESNDWLDVDDIDVA